MVCNHLPAEKSMKTLLLALWSATVALCGAATAADTIKILVPANPGGGWDQTGRALAQALQSAGIAKTVRVENRGGAGGTIGIAQFVNSAKGDPEALMIGGLVMVGAIELNKSPVTLAQVTPIARLTAEYEAITVPAASKFQSLRDLLAAFKASPGSVSWGGGSAGGVDHILVGLLAKEIGAQASKINYVPYAGGGEAIQSILGGHVSAGVSGWGEFAPHVQSGKMRALAVSSATRLADAKNVPTLKELGLNLEVFNWRGVFGAPGISAAQRAALTKQVSDAVKSRSWQETLKRNDWSDVLLTGDQFKAYIESEQKRVALVLKDIGLAK
jgi:putative tricarboxylic transport membrane protein